MLWLLERHDVADYDEYNGFVVRAGDEIEARRVAYDHSGYTSKDYDSREKRWLDPTKTSCRPIEVDGPAACILSSFRAG